MEITALKESKIGFIGGGNMARAIAIPLIRRGIVLPHNLWVSATTRKTLDYWRQISIPHPVNTTLNNVDILWSCDIVFLAVKPQFLNAALAEAIPIFNAKSVALGCVRDIQFVSVIAGVTLATLEKKLVNSFQGIPKIIRTMPNMALSIGEGITVYCCNRETTPGDALPIVTLFSQLGVIEEVLESQMDVAGALAGSGPAYGYLMIEALSDGAVRNGLPRAVATKFAAQVLAGAGKMLLMTGKHPGQLKDEVCSPGGTTIAGIHALEQGSVRASLMNAIDAAFKRSKELGSSN